MIRVTAIAVAVVGLLCGTVWAATCCHQTFTVLGKTAGENGLLFFAEYWDGECLSGYVFAIALFDGSSHAMSSGYQNTDWFSESMKDIPMETPVELVNDSGVFRIGDSIVIAPPEFDSTFYARLGEWGGTVNGWQFNCKEDCRDLPRISGSRATCVYIHNSGMYKNYEIDRVFRYAESGYLLLITKQEVLAAGMDTMHGLLVYKLGDTSDRKGE